MKTFIIITLLFFTNVLNADELSWVNKQIEAIKPPRSGLNHNSLSMLSDPFIFLNKNKEKKDVKKGSRTSRTATKVSTSKSTNKIVAKKKTSLTVDAIMNKSALINGKWYKLGEKIGSYKLAKIKPTSVLLTNSNKKLILSTRSINKNLNFKNK